MAKAKAYTNQLKELMADKSRLLSKAQALEEMGLGETAEPLWASAALREERIAPLLEMLGRSAEAALHRVSAAACYEKCGDPSRAANLYRAALAGPLAQAAKREAHKRMSACFKQLKRHSHAPSVA